MPFWFFALISCSCSFLLKCVKCRHFPLGNGNRLHHHTVEKVFAEPKLYHSWQPLCMRIVRKVCCVLHCSMNKKIHKTRKISDERQNIPLKYSILFATLIILWYVLFAFRTLHRIHNFFSCSTIVPKFCAFHSHASGSGPLLSVLNILLSDFIRDLINIL